MNDDPIDRYGNDTRHTSGDRPAYQQVDPYDRLLGMLDGLQGTMTTSPTTIQITNLVGAQTFMVRTIRKQDRELESTGFDPKEIVHPPEFYIFLEYHAANTHQRIAIPPKVADLIARQRDALTTRAVKAGAKKAAATRKARGIEPNIEALRKGREAAKKKGKGKK